MRIVLLKRVFKRFVFGSFVQVCGVFHTQKKDFDSGSLHTQESLLTGFIVSTILWTQRKGGFLNPVESVNSSSEQTWLKTCRNLKLVPDSWRPWKVLLWTTFLSPHPPIGGVPLNARLFRKQTDMCRLHYQLALSVYVGFDFHLAGNTPQNPGERDWHLRATNRVMQTGRKNRKMSW